MKEFLNKTIIVTGGTSGIGKATAELFLENGANTCIADINDTEGIKIENMHTMSGSNIKFIKTDVTKFEDLKTLVNETFKKFGSIDVVFNAAGFEGRIKELKDTTIEEWDEVIDLHLKACFMMSKIVIPIMMKQKSGVIINVGSEIGTSFRFAPRYVPYGTSKAAVMAFTKALAVEVAQYNIRVNCVSPGAVNSPMLKREVKKYVQNGLFKTEKEALDNVYASYPIGFIGEPEDIANAVLYLASDKARFATGSVFSIDGGGGII